VDTDGLESRLHERRARKQITQKAGRGLLAVAVLTGSGFGIVGLNRAFRGNGETTLAVPPATNGPIVVSFGDDGGTHLYLQNPDDPNWDPRDHQLTNDLSKDSAPAVSPDGREIAFVREDLERGRLSVWTMTADGSDLQQISPNDWNANFPTWAPDGKQIAFIGGDAEDIGVYVTNVEGDSILRRLPATGLGGVLVGLAWSPEADRIAVAVSNGTGGSSISMIDVASGESRLVAPTYWDVGPPSWSPDGRSMTFANGYGIVTLELDGTVVTELTPVRTPQFPGSPALRFVDSNPVWSPDGEWIAFERFFSPSEFFVYAVRTDGTGLHRIGLGGDPAWSVPQPAAPETSGTTVEPTATLLVSGNGLSGDSALLEGPLSLSNGCVGVRAGGTFTYLIWPAGSRLVVDDGGLTVKDETGAAAASIGDTIRMGGGIDSLGRAEEVVVGGIPDACQEPGVNYWYVGQIEQVGAPRSPGGSTVIVPDVIGLSLDDARVAIEASGLVVGHLQVEPGSYTTAVVVEQRPAAGSEVAPGSAVDLVTGPSGSG
jgi:hypothetical protein